MPDDVLSGDRLLSQRNRAPLATFLGVPVAVDADTAGQENGVAAQTTQPVTQENSQGSQPKVFTVPRFGGDAGFRNVNFAAEIPQTEGIADEDSYLFITADTPSHLKDKKYRVFVAPKSDPSKAQEIPVTAAELDTDSHEFHARFGQGHDFVISFNNAGSGSALLDGKHVRSIDSTEEIHSLVKQERWVSLPRFGFKADREHSVDDTGVSDASRVFGDSWIILQKDYDTGLIQRWTQSGTSNVVVSKSLRVSQKTHVGCMKPRMMSALFHPRRECPCQNSMKNAALDARTGYIHKSERQSLENILNSSHQQAPRQKEGSGDAGRNEDQRMEQTPRKNWLQP